MFFVVFTKGDTRTSGPEVDTRSGNILSFLLPLIQEGQLSVTGCLTQEPEVPRARCTEFDTRSGHIRRQLSATGCLTQEPEVPRARCTEFDIRSGHIFSFLLPLIQEGQLSVTGCMTQEPEVPRARCPEFDIRSGHILSFLLPLIQEGQLSVTGCLTQEPEVSRVRYPVRPHTFASSSADSRRAVVSYW